MYFDANYRLPVISSPWVPGSRETPRASAMPERRIQANSSTAIWGSAKLGVYIAPSDSGIQVYPTADLDMGKKSKKMLELGITAHFFVGIMSRNPIQKTVIQPHE